MIEAEKKAYQEFMELEDWGGLNEVFEYTSYGD